MAVNALTSPQSSIGDMKFWADKETTTDKKLTPPEGSQHYVLLLALG